MFKNKLQKICYGGLMAAAGVSLAVVNSIMPLTATPQLRAIIDASSPSGVAVQGANQEVLRFTLAAQAVDFSIQGIKFNKQGSCSSVGTGEVTLYEVVDPGNPYAILPAGTAWFKLGNFSITNFSRPLTIAAGSLKTLALKGDTTGCKGAVRFSIVSRGITALYLKPTSFSAGNVSGKSLVFSTAPADNSALTAALSVGSPSGAHVPGVGQEVLRFNLASSGNKDAEIKELNFKPTTTCQNFTTNSGASLYDNADLTTPLKTWTWTNSSEFLNGFSAQGLSKTIAAGTLKTFTLKFDTTGCSAINDEVFRLDLTGGSWQAQPGGALSTTIKNIPVLGGTMVY